MSCCASRWCRGLAPMAPPRRPRSRPPSRPGCCSGSCGAGLDCTCWRSGRAAKRAPRSGWTANVRVVSFLMTATELKDLLERVQAWPEEAQHELVAVANQIENELQGRNYLATQEELRIIDAAMAAIDGGEIATDVEIKAALTKFRPA